MITYIKNAAGLIKYEFDGDWIREFGTARNLYRFRNTNCGLSLYEWSMKRLYSFEDGKVYDYFGAVLYRYDGCFFRDSNQKILYRYENKFVQTFNYQKLFQIDGPASQSEIALLITAIEKGLVVFPR